MKLNRYVVVFILHLTIISAIAVCNASDLRGILGLGLSNSISAGITACPGGTSTGYCPTGTGCPANSVCQTGVCCATASTGQGSPIGQSGYQQGCPYGNIAGECIAGDICGTLNGVQLVCISGACCRTDY